MRDWSKVSLQTIFNHVSRHLIKQNKRAVGIFGSCVCYDEKTRMRCAVGSLIPIKDYKGETLSLYDVYESTNLLNYSDKNNLLGDLRSCHDGVKPSRWPSRLRAIAKQYDLEIPEFLHA